MSVKNLKAKKNELRARYKKLRDSFPTEKKSDFDRKLTENILNLDEYKRAEVLFAFISKDIEVDTTAIIADAFSSGKRVAVPRCNEDTTITFYYISSYDDLEKGYYGLLEPDTERCVRAEEKDADMVLVPGLVYDREGFRLGFGKGYYDRFLTDYDGLTVGVCYSRCIEEKLPRGFYDRPIKLVVTEKYTIDTRE